MGDIAALAAAFESDVRKGLQTLPFPPPPRLHEQFLVHYKQTQRLQTLVAEYTSRLPAHASVPRLLATASQLYQRKDFRLAGVCYQHVLAYDLPTSDDAALRMDRVGCHLQAEIGNAACHYHALVAGDPEFRHPDTLQGVLKCLATYKACALTATQQDDQYWIVLNASKHVYASTFAMATARFSAEALPFVLFTVAAIEAQVMLGTPKYLQWRLQLYNLACFCYKDLAAHGAALAFLGAGIQQITKLVHIQQLDAVPAKPEVLAHYDTAQRALVALQLQFRSISSPVVLEAVLSKHFQSGQERLRAIVNCLNAPSKRCVQRSPAAAESAACFAVAANLLKPVLEELLTLGSEVLATDTAGPEQATETQQRYKKAEVLLPIDVHQALLCAAFNGESMELFAQLAQAAEARGRLANSHSQPAAACLNGAAHVLGAVGQLNQSPGAEALAALAAALEDHAAAMGCLPELLTDAALALRESSQAVLESVFCMQDPDAKLACDILSSMHAVFEVVQLDDALLRGCTAMKAGLLLEEQGALQHACSVLKQGVDSVESARAEMLHATRHKEGEHLRWISASRSQGSDGNAALVAGMTEVEQQAACLHADLFALLQRVELRLGLEHQSLQAAARKNRLESTLAKRDAQADIFGTRTVKEMRVDKAKLDKAASTATNPAARERELLASCGKNGYQRALLLLQAACYQADQHRQAAMLEEAADLLDKAQAAEEELLSLASLAAPSTRTPSPQPPKILYRTPTSLSLTTPPLCLRSNNKLPASFAVYCKPYGAGVALALNSTAAEYPGTGVKVPIGGRVTIEGLRPNDTYMVAIAVYDAEGSLIGQLGASTPQILAALPLPLLHCWAHLGLVAAKLGLWGAVLRATSHLYPHFITTTPDRPLWQANPMDTLDVHRAHVEAAAVPLLRSFAQLVYVHTDRGARALVAPAGGWGFPGGGEVGSLQELREPYLERQVECLQSCRVLLIGMEVAAVVGDEILVQEGAARAHRMLAPLLALHTRPLELQKALATMYLTLQSIKKATQSAQRTGQALQLQTATRVCSTATYHLLQLGRRAAEPSAVAYFAKLECALLEPPVEAAAQGCATGSPGLQSSASGKAEMAADCKVKPAAAAAAAAAAATTTVSTAAAQLPELEKLQCILLQHAGQGAGGSSSLLAARLKDAADLAARVLPLLKGRGPLEAWKVLLEEPTAATSPRWLELAVSTVEAMVAAGHGAQAKLAGARIHEVTRSATRAYWPCFPKWSLQTGADALEGVQLPAGQAPPAPAAEGLSEEEKQQLDEAHQLVVDGAIKQERRRVAAVVLLQQRLPRMLHRRKQVLQIRQQQAERHGWLAQLNICLGLLAAEEACTAAPELPPAAPPLPPSLGKARPGSPKGKEPGRPSSPPAAKGKEAGRPSSPPAAKGKDAGKAPGSPAKGKDAGKGAKLKGASNAPELPQEEPPAAAPTSHSAALAALQHLARAANLAARSEGWQQLLVSLQHFSSVMAPLLNATPALTDPLPRCTWELGPLPLFTPYPEPLPPRDQANSPAGKGKAAAGKGDTAKKPPTPSKKPPSAKAGAKGSAADTSGSPKAPPRSYLSPANCGPNIARAIRSAMEALLDVASALRSGVAVHIGYMPTARDAVAPRPGTGRSDAYTPSNFSFGSDLQVDLWFRRQCALDVEWATHMLLQALAALTRMERWHCTHSLGKQWQVATEGVFAEQLLPYMLAAAPFAGQDAAPLAAQLAACVRDKTQGLDQLHQARALVRDRLADTPLLSGNPSHKAKKKKRAVAPPSRTAGARAGLSESSSFRAPSEGGWDASTVASFRTAASGRTGKSQLPDHLRLPTEYEKVIETLRKRGEKSNLVLATNELGDVFAHFGMWVEAGRAWNDALDTAVGPYQVLKDWRRALLPLQPQQLLRSYGVHGLLLAGGILLGKLARYCYCEDLGMRVEACRMGAALLRGVFASSLAHPQRTLDLGTHTPLHLWDNAQLFTDPYRCNVADLMGGVETISSVLLDCGLPLDALPAICIWEHLARHTTRSLPATVLARTARVRALEQLGQVGEAMGVLASLMAADELPCAFLQSPLVVKDDKGNALQPVKSAPFSNTLPPGHPTNRPATDILTANRLPAPVAALYGRWLCSRITIARAALLACLGRHRHLWKATDPSGSAASQPSVEAVEEKLLEAAAAPLLSLAADCRQRLAAQGGGGEGAAQSGEQELSAAAEDADILCRALLQLSVVEGLRWHGQAALEAALEAVRVVAAHGEIASVISSGNEVLERLAFGPLPWLQARLQVAECCRQLGHLSTCQALLPIVLQEAASVRDTLVAPALLHCQATCAAAQGHPAACLAALADAATRYKKLAVQGRVLAAVLAEGARLKEELGLLEGSRELWEEAAAACRGELALLGLPEMQEQPERINIYTPGVQLLADTLLALSTAALRHREPARALQLSVEARALLPCTRAPPSLHAAVALTCGRALRVLAVEDAGGKEGGVEEEWGVGGDGAGQLQEVAQMLSSCRLQLQQCLTWGIQDGGHHWTQIRSALLEAAFLAASSMDDRRALQCLRAATAVAAQRDILQYALQQLLQGAGLGAAALPKWLQALFAGREAAHAAKHGMQVKPLSDVDNLRLALCQLAALTHSPPSARLHECRQAEAQRALLHSLLRGSCPPYSSQCCLPDVPNLLQDLPPSPPPEGTVVVQWLCQDTPTASPSQARPPTPTTRTDSAALCLRPPSRQATLLYVIHPPAVRPATPLLQLPASVLQQGGVACAAVHFDLEAIRKLQRQVKDVRERTEAPQQPGQVHGRPAPTPQELAALLDSMEACLSQADTDLPTPAATARCSTAATTQQPAAEGIDVASTLPPFASAAAAAAAAAASSAAAPPPPSARTSSAASKPAAPSKLGAAKGSAAAAAAAAEAEAAAAAAAAAAASGPPGSLQLKGQRLVELEALLEVEGGLDILDPQLAAWLLPLLLR